MWFSVRGMAGASEVRAGVASDASVAVPSQVPDAVVRPLGAVVARPCARPGCSVPAVATLTFRYPTREAWIERLVDEPRHQSYDLCPAHAARTKPPHGWQLRDRRPEDERRVELPPAPPADLGGDRTVAVLAAALRAVPDAVSEDVARDPAAEAGVVPDEGARGAAGPTVTGGPAPTPAGRPPLAARRRSSE
jgi:hypothetical protein